MLTQTAAGRTYDYSYCVGGRMGQPASVAIGSGDTVYVLLRGTENIPNVPANRSTSGARIGIYSIGAAAGDEEVVDEIGSAGEADGEFIWPAGVALDSQENVYVTDEWLNRISVFDSKGNLLRMWGSEGEGDGEFNGPSGIALDQDDNVYVVDSRNHRIQKLTKDGKFLTKWGNLGSGEGELDSPWGITVDQQGNVYVADHKNHRAQKFTSDGDFVTSFGSHGTGAGQLNRPTDVAVDPDGDVYVCDWANNRVQAFRPDGKYLANIIGDAQQPGMWHQQTIDANADTQKARRRVYSLEPEWRFVMPRGVAFDSKKGRLLVADTHRGRIQIYDKLSNYQDPQFNL